MLSPRNPPSPGARLRRDRTAPHGRELPRRSGATGRSGTGVPSPFPDFPPAELKGRSATAHRAVGRGLLGPPHPSLEGRGGLARGVPWWEPPSSAAPAPGFRGPSLPWPPGTGVQPGLGGGLFVGGAEPLPGLFREVCSGERDERCRHAGARPRLPPAPPARPCAGRPEEVTTARCRAARPRVPALLFLPPAALAGAALPAGRTPCPRDGGLQRGSGDPRSSRVGVAHGRRPRGVRRPPWPHAAKGGWASPSGVFTSPVVLGVIFLL